MVHREHLCAKTLQMPHVMNLVVKTVNKIRVGGRGLLHREFQEFLEEIEAEYTDIPYFMEVRWLSRGKIFERFFLLRKEIATFMEMLGEPVPELQIYSRVEDLAFLSDIVKHLNVLNQSLQGVDKIITNMIDTVKAFMRKHDLWQKQMAQGNIENFQNFILCEQYGLLMIW